MPGHGLEIVTHVNGIPKGSRLAVSTNLLASIIAVCMRATGQVRTLDGNAGRKMSAAWWPARAILGEWLGGSGGGWQDSGGVWPGMKVIQGVLAAEGDPEFGISRGCLLPRHHVLTNEEVAADRRETRNSLVLVHGGMAQDVGPILEMVTEKYLLRAEAEWQGRQQAIAIFDEILALLESRRHSARIGGGHGTQLLRAHPDHHPVGQQSLHRNADPTRVRAEFGADFHGFWMLGGMAGGGMGFMFDPGARPQAQERLRAMMRETKRRLERRRAVRHGAGGLRFRHQRTRHGGRSCWRATPR